MAVLQPGLAWAIPVVPAAAGPHGTAPYQKFARTWEPSEHKAEIDTVNTSLCSKKKSLKLLLSKILSLVLGVEDACILERVLHSTVCED